MKVTPGTNKPSRDKKFTTETSGQPQKKANSLKIPEGAKDVSHTIRKISNGYIQSTSYKHKDDYHHHEIYHPSDPLDQEGGGEEKNPIGDTGGIKSK